MSNMSYCRFRNTLRDLYDCDEHMADPDLSAEETEARTKLFELCVKIVTDFDAEIAESEFDD